MELQQGGNLGIRGEAVSVRIELNGPPGGDFDVSAFLLTAHGRVRGDGDMIFHNQPAGAAGAIRMIDVSAAGARFEVGLRAIPMGIEKISFCVAAGQDGPQLPLSSLRTAAIEVRQGGTLLARFAPSLGAAVEKSMTLGELYRRGGDWKFRAVGQGFKGGIDRLARAFGVDVEAPPAPPEPPFAARDQRPASQSATGSGGARAQAGQGRGSEAFAAPPNAAPPPRPISAGTSRAVELARRAQPPADPFPDIASAEKGDSGIGRGLHFLAIAWGAVLAVALLLTMFGLGIIGILMVLAATFYAALQAIALVRARGQVLRSGEVDIWSGWGKLVSWNPNEGVVFLRNKEFAFFTQGGGTSGGIQVVLPFMGEELAFRTSIETRQVFYEDAKVFTKEMIPLLVRANIYWRVSNVGRFYLGVGRDVRSVRDSGGSNPLAGDKEGAARSWLCAIAEEETRRVIARVGAGLLISDQLMDDMMLIGRPDIAEWSQQLGGGRGYRGVTDVIVEEIERAYNERLNCYGVHVERVALQEMSAPPEIYGAAQAALKASFDPAIARARAMARRIELENEAELIGKDALALKEIAGNLPALAFQDMLGPLFSRFGQRRGAGI